MADLYSSTNIRQSRCVTANSIKAIADRHNATKEIVSELKEKVMTAVTCDEYESAMIALHESQELIARLTAEIEEATKPKWTRRKAPYPQTLENTGLLQ